MIDWNTVRKILVIDDDANRAKPLIDMGFDVRVAYGFEQINLLLGTWDPELIFLDYDMPLMSGIQVVHIFGDKMVQMCDIIIWSMNSYGAEQLANILMQKALEVESEYELLVTPWDIMIHRIKRRRKV